MNTRSRPKRKKKKKTNLFLHMILMDKSMRILADLSVTT